MKRCGCGKEATAWRPFEPVCAECVAAFDRGFVRGLDMNNWSWPLRLLWAAAVGYAIAQLILRRLQ